MHTHGHVVVHAARLQSMALVHPRQLNVKNFGAPDLADYLKPAVQRPAETQSCRE